MTALVTKPIGQMRLTNGSIVTVPNVTWSEFEAILIERSHQSHGRIAYYQGTLLEIMVSLPEHERPKELIADIVKALLKKQRIPYEPFGFTTFKQLGTAGIEPTDTSPIFPAVSIIDVVNHTVERSWQVGSYQALVEFEETVLTMLENTAFPID